MASLSVKRPKDLVEIFGEEKLLAKEAEIFEAVYQKVNSQILNPTIIGQKSRNMIVDYFSRAHIDKYYAALLASANKIKEKRHLNNSDLAGILELVPIEII
jgi:replication-associated recombination protein RarA